MGEFKKRNIIDIAEFDRKLDEIRAKVESSPSKGVRQELLALFRNTLEKGREHLRKCHLQGASGKFIVRGHSHLMDVLLQRLHTLAREINLMNAGGEEETSDTPKKHLPLLQRLAQAIQARRDARSAREDFVLIAIGGYGRGELAPYSDIDLLFLLPDEIRPNLAMRVESILYFLWDLGLEVGHAVRSIPECLEHAKTDQEIRTTMLESRFLAGDDALFNRYRTTLFDRVIHQDPDAFLREKLVEQRKRHDRFGNSLFYLEPNIKENPGGLRDIHTFFWISKYRYRVNKVRELIEPGIITQDEYKAFMRARKFLWRVRNALHYRAGRRDDRLTFNHQIEIAEEFGYRDRAGGMRGVELFMRRYYQVAKQVSQLSGIFLQKYMEEARTIQPNSHRQLEHGFRLVGEKITLTDQDAFSKNPILIMHLFALAQRHLKGIHPDTMRQVHLNLNRINRQFRHNPEVNEIFLRMLDGKRAVAWVLNRMNTSGVLGRFIPEFGRITGQSQHDLFHVYTVDEHSIRAVEALRQIKNGKFTEELPISTRLMAKLRNPIVLYVAVLLHDIAKGRGGQHEVKGAVVARTVCKRLGMTQADTDLVCWLVRSHLIFSRTAFRRDINDPATVSKFVDQIGDQQRLDLLLLLTVADIRAVGPGIWNPWKANLLRRLHGEAEIRLGKGLSQPEDWHERLEFRIQAVSEIITTHGHKEQRVRTHLDRFYPGYLLTYCAEDVADHFLALEPFLNDDLAVVFQSHTDSQTTILLVYTLDQAGLLARISGTLSGAGANILSVNAHTTKDGMILDIFELQGSRGGVIESDYKLNRLQQSLNDVLTGRTNPEQLMEKTGFAPSKPGPFEVPTTIVVDNKMSPHYTLLEVTTLDRTGLLYTITRELQLRGLQIRTAKIATYGERAVDVFYVRDLFGMKLDDERVESVSRDLTLAIDALGA
ncbi:MAG: [protein-PII] uridylyltransferase [Magnetococcales bacterium]|nr:[protein-PII] uridylyltransferase [Magnetococcales bacterium]